MTSLEISRLLRSPTSALALGGVDLVHHPLVGERALLEPVLVLDLPRPDLEAPLAELVEPADALDGAVAGPVLLLQLVHPVERGAGDHQPRAELLVLLLGAVLDDAEAADQPRQREALSDHGDEDQREGDELDQLAAGQRRAGVGAAAAAPAPPPARPRRASPPSSRRPGCASSTRRATLRGPAVDRPDEEGDDEVPQEADRDHRRADRRRVADDLARRPAAEPVDDRRQLQPDEDEQRRVEQEGERRPQPVRPASGSPARRSPARGSRGRRRRRPRPGRPRRRADRPGRTPRRR